MRPPSGEFWSGRRVLVTGHTGFKGAWLCHWLERLGALVHGVALPPISSPSLYELAALRLDLGETIADIALEGPLDEAFRKADPQIVIHLAAQALVPAAQTDPVGCYVSNVIGTLRVLEACRRVRMPDAALIVTTDKVYRNDESGQAFSEDDALGGDDPYSASKTCCEILVASHRRTLMRQAAGRIGVARAGNVVGAGDWAPDRLVPDAIRAFAQGQSVALRDPEAVRPWQHVLEPLGGYLLFCEAISAGAAGLPDALNFGPPAGDDIEVRKLVERLAASFGVADGWRRMADPAISEHRILRLSSERARTTLGWEPRLTVGEAIAWTADGYRLLLDGKDARDLVRGQIAAYEALMS